MAPVPPHSKPSARTLRHQRVTGQIHPLLPSKIFRPGAATSDSFLSNKRDKRLMKHSSFLSRVQSSSDKISKSGNRRHRTRRPANKIASLGSLGDALPDLEQGDGAAAAAGKVHHRSLKSRPGALKRKEKVVKGEMQRFGMSMARLAEVPGAASDNPSASEGDFPQDGAGAGVQEAAASTSSQPAASAPNRWAALRGYISATMEQNPAFANKP